MDIFSQRFKELKELKNATYQQIADIVGVQLRTAQYYASGKVKPDYCGLLALAEYFGCSIDFLTGRTNCPDILTYDKDGNPVIIEAMKPHSDNSDVNK